MRVKMLTSFGGQGFSVTVGDVVELPEDVARRYIEKDMAVETDAPVTVIIPERPPVLPAEPRIQIGSLAGVPDDELVGGTGITTRDITRIVDQRLRELGLLKARATPGRPPKGKQS